MRDGLRVDIRCFFSDGPRGIMSTNLFEITSILYKKKKNQ